MLCITLCANGVTVVLIAPMMPACLLPTCSCNGKEGTMVLAPLPKARPWGSNGIYSEYAIWRDSKLQMLFYLKSIFFLLVLWIFFHPWGVTEQSTLAQSWMTYFPWQNQNVLLRVYSGPWNRGFFCEDYCPVSLYLCFEFSVVLWMTAALKLALNAQTMSHSVSETPSEANKPAQHIMLTLTPVPNLCWLSQDAMHCLQGELQEWGVWVKKAGLLQEFRSISCELLSVLVNP